MGVAPTWSPNAFGAEPNENKKEAEGGRDMGECPPPLLTPPPPDDQRSRVGNVRITAASTGLRLSYHQQELDPVESAVEASRFLFPMAERIIVRGIDICVIRLADTFSRAAVLQEHACACVHTCQGAAHV